MFKCFSKVFALLLCAFVCAEFKALAQADEALQTFVLNEDIMLENGLIICVNSAEQKLSRKGFGLRQKTEFFINLTLVNNGYQTITIDPKKNFILNTGAEAAVSEANKAKSAFNRPFSLSPTLQTRVNLFFSAKTKANTTPKLVFKLNGEALQIICAPDSKPAQGLNKAEMPLNTALQLAEELLSLGKNEEAEQILAPLYERHFLNYKLSLILAFCAKERSDFCKAETCLNNINKNSIKSLSEAVNAAELAMRLSLYKKAIELLEPYEFAGNLNEKNRCILAQAYYFVNDFVSSAGIIEPMLEQGTKEAQAYFVYGNMLNKQNKIEKAIKFWQKAVELNASFAEARFNLGVGYMQLNRLIDAQTEWQIILNQNPNSDIAQLARRALDNCK